MKTGFFIMEDVNNVLKCNNIFEARKYAHERVKEFTNAKKYNIIKIKELINSVTTVERLAFMISNHILAHPSENMKAI